LQDVISAGYRAEGLLNHSFQGGDEVNGNHTPRHTPRVTTRHTPRHATRHLRARTKKSSRCTAELLKALQL